MIRIGFALSRVVLDGRELMPPADAERPRDPAWEDPTVRRSWHLLHWWDLLVTLAVTALLVAAPIFGTSAAEDDVRIQRVGVPIDATCVVIAKDLLASDPIITFQIDEGNNITAGYSVGLAVPSSGYTVGQKVRVLIDPAHPGFVGFLDGTSNDGNAKRRWQWRLFLLAAALGLLMVQRAVYGYRLTSLLQSQPGVPRVLGRAGIIGRDNRSIQVRLLFHEEPNHPGTHLVLRRAFGSRVSLGSLVRTPEDVPATIVAQPGRTVAVVLPGQRAFLAVLPRSASAGREWLHIR